MLELKVHHYDREIVLKFEHSLRSVSKWEAKFKKPFMTKERNALEMIDYYCEMFLNEDEDPKLVYALAPEQLEALAKYINETPTASSVPKEAGRPSGEQVTSELIYYWMTEMKIPWEAQDWHLGRLMMLIQITNYKRQPAKKQRIGDLRSKWQAMNEANRKKFNSDG